MLRTGKSLPGGLIMVTILSLGVEAEIADINMYKNFLSSPNLLDDVKMVFTQLKAGSENHLNAFENGLQRYQ